MYKQLPDKLSYPDLEIDVLSFWESNAIFEQSLELRKDAPFFNFYEGPPTVNGKPGIHHLMARTLKDLICRYKTMNGFYVRRQAGWDTHGLPVEIAVEKQLGLVNKSDIEKMGVEKFNRACKEMVYNNIKMDGGWREFTHRMGFWVNMDTAYITCTNDYVESVWWALKQFFDKGLIYKGFKVVPQSPTIETPLSSHELSLGYREVRDPNCYLKLKITSSNVPNITGASVLVWTTTPWTLFANTALAVGEKIEYVLVKNTRPVDGVLTTELFVLATTRLSILDGEVEVVSTFTGKELLESRYEQIFTDCAIDLVKHPNALSFLGGSFVSTDDGSGVVHLAPAFGVDDFEMSKKFGLPMLQPVTPNGHFTTEIVDFAGRAIKNFKYADHNEEGADKDIIIALKKAGKIYKSSMDYVHSYPHCWRTDNPVMYYARDSWFIKSPEYKDTMIALNKTIRWQPPEIGSGRFGNWLEEVKDWSLSRDRFWGTPLPIWVSEDGKDMFAVGSIAELMEGKYELREGHFIPVSECGREVDLHRPFVDNVVFERNGQLYRRVHEVVDVWFDSGAVPFAQMHYPFENKELFEKSFPADYIAEGIDQTRGWFYTLHNIASAIFGKPAFKSIIVNELILDKNGQKMSKSKGNTVDPFEMMSKYGADAVRWYFLVNNPPWKPTLFNQKDIEDTVIADFFRSLTNSYKFYALYANIDEITGMEAEVPVAERPELDRWILSTLHTVIQKFRDYMESYELTRAMRLLQDFARLEVSNWYVRRNRRRFWKGEKDSEKLAAYQTLRTVLMNIAAMMAPAAPFLSEDLFLRLRNENDSMSVHLMDFPASDESLIDKDLERRMETAQKVVFLARSLREKSKIRTRQPLRRILVPVISPQQRRDLQAVEDIILEELNVKAVEYVSEETGIVKRSAKANFKTLGKKCGKNTQNVANVIKELPPAALRMLQQNGNYILKVGDEEYDLTTEDIEIISEDIEGWLVASEGALTVALDTEIDDDLRGRRNCPRICESIQNSRKQMGLEVTDRIDLSYWCSDTVHKAIEQMTEYIQSETLAQSVTYAKSSESESVEIEGEILSLTIRKS
ncbi:MAG: isoleucine--tRNA ligase [Ignavibacteria bacterium]|nr:isoleucine--tRNA ligase [Ignavibacteria bacterium]